MLVSPIWPRWPDARKASWMNSWITCTVSADRLVWTTIFPLLKRDSARDHFAVRVFHCTNPAARRFLLKAGIALWASELLPL